MLRPPETLCPPQPARLQSWTDSFWSCGHSLKCVTVFGKYSSPASSSKPSWVQKVRVRNWARTAAAQIRHWPGLKLLDKRMSSSTSVIPIRVFQWDYHTFFTHSRWQQVLIRSRDYLSTRSFLWLCIRELGTKRWAIFLCSWQADLGKPQHLVGLTKAVLGRGSCVMSSHGRGWVDRQLMSRCRTGFTREGM